MTEPWTDQELARAEVEVGLRSAPDPGEVVPPPFETETFDDRLFLTAWWARASALVFVLGIAGAVTIGIDEDDRGPSRLAKYPWPHLERPAQLIGTIIATPLAVMIACAALYGIYRFLRWVITSR